MLKQIGCNEESINTVESLNLEERYKNEMKSIIVEIQEMIVNIIDTKPFVITENELSYVLKITAKQHSIFRTYFYDILLKENNLKLFMQHLDLRNV